MKITVEITRQENADHFGVNIGDTAEVEFEEYVAAVVASEIGNAAPEACKAQAVAARTYAIHRGVLNGKKISDSSATAQAYRAARCDREKYPNPVKAAEETKGQALVYGKDIIDAVYSAGNGGWAVSSEEQWGSYRPYLIAHPDPWDAMDGRPRSGHGVGMSQRGAMQAASNGYTYTDILAFYYPGTEIVADYNRKTIEKEGVDTLENEKSRAVAELAEESLGDPYVFGARGEECTPGIRKSYASYHPEYRDKIYGACPVLNGKLKSCDGCKWKGHRCYDCRGFTYYCLKAAANIVLEGGGATSQYECGRNWAQRGTVDSIPDVLCCVFKKKDNKMSHTGLHVGGGHLIHCSTTVKRGEITDSGWTHYAIPAGLYTEEELKNAPPLVTHPTLKRGSRGAAVTRLQETLNTLGFNCGTADGIFGAKTEEAVRNFQSSAGLKADGIVGAQTWEALEQKDPAEPAPPEDEETPGAEPTVYERLDALERTVKGILEWIAKQTNMA